MEPKALMKRFYSFVNLHAKTMPHNNGEPFSQEAVNHNLSVFRFDGTDGLNDDDAKTILKTLGFENPDVDGNNTTNAADVSFALCNLMQPGIGSHQPDNKFDSSEIENTLKKLEALINPPQRKTYRA